LFHASVRRAADVRDEFGADPTHQRSFLRATVELRQRMRAAVGAYRAGNFVVVGQEN
jgi:hypothetical protein